MFNFINQLRGLLLITLLSVITACGSDGGDGGESPSVYVTDVQLNSTQTSLPAGVSQLVEGVATFSDGETRSASSTNSTWSSDNEKIATVDAFGVVIGVGEGTTSINALYKGAQDAEGEFVTGIIEITITPAEVVEIQLYSEVNTVALGVDVQYQVFAKYSDETNDELGSNNITWTSSNPAAAQVDASTGIAETLSAEETTISVDFQGLQSSSLLTVTAATLVSLSISPEVPGETSVPAGYTFNFTAEGTYSDDSTGPMTNDVTWLAINHTALEAIEPKGTFRGVSPDDAGVKASFGEISNQIPVIVTPEVLLSVDIEPDQGSFPIGIRTQLTARGYFSNNVNKNITSQDNVSWESDTPAFATVDTDGILTAKSVGDVTITLNVKNTDGVVFSDTQFFTVTEAELIPNSIEITPKGLYLVPGASHNYIAKGQFTDGSEHILNYQDDIVWSLTDFNHDSITNSIASIQPKTGIINNQSNNGLAKTIQIYVKAKVDGHTGLTFADLGAVNVLKAVDENNLSFSGPFSRFDARQLGLIFESEVENVENGSSGPDMVHIIMLTQAEADSACENLVYNRHSDYRLPTADELVLVWKKYDNETDDNYKLYTEQKWSVGENFWTATSEDAGNTFKVMDLREGLEQSASSNTEHHYFSCVRTTVLP